MSVKNFIDEYFEKYQNSEKKNFGQLSRYLSKLSQKKCNDVINIGGMKIPNYLPDQNLDKFYKVLRTEEGWKEEEIKEVRFVCKAYMGIQFNNDQECLEMLELMNNLWPDRKYDSLIKYFTCEDTDLDTDILIGLMSDGNNPVNPLIASYILTTEINEVSHFE